MERSSLRTPDTGISNADQVSYQSTGISFKPPVQYRQSNPESDILRSPTTIQAKFTVDKEYNNNNKDELTNKGALLGAIGDQPYQQSMLSVIRSYAAMNNDLGQKSWQELVSMTKDNMKSDANQFDLAAQQLLARYNPAEWVFVGLGSSPDPVTFRMRALNEEAVILDFPISNIDQYVLNTAFTYLAVGSEEDFIKKKNEVEEEEDGPETVSDYIDNNGSKDFSEKIREPFALIQTLKSHLAAFVGTGKLGGRTNVLLIDYVASGASLMQATKLLRTYYGHDYTVAPFGFGDPFDHQEEQFAKLNEPEEQGDNSLSIQKLTEVFASVIYKDGHRLFGKFDLLAIKQQIKQAVALEDDIEFDEIPGLEDFYQALQENAAAKQNLGELFKFLDEEIEELEEEEEEANGGVELPENVSAMLAAIKDLGLNVEEDDEVQIRAALLQNNVPQDFLFSIQSVQPELYGLIQDNLPELWRQHMEEEE